MQVILLNEMTPAGQATVFREASVLDIPATTVLVGATQGLDGQLGDVPPLWAHTCLMAGQGLKASHRNPAAMLVEINKQQSAHLDRMQSHY